MTDVHGVVPAEFEPLAETFKGLLEDGTDVGASVAVCIDGEPVIDLWGGWIDEERTRPWERDTLVNVWSTTKPMTSLVALMLVDRGLVDLDAPVARYWPEFAQNGKEGVLFRHFMAHSSGVSGWAQPCSQEDVYDQDRSAQMFASQPPWWKPGSTSGYHAINYGHLIGEVVRRVDGRSLGTFFREEVAGPLGADFHIGLAPEHDARVSPVIPPPPLPFDFSAVDPDSPLVKTLGGPPVDASYANTEAWRRAEIGAANGHGNGRSIARVQSVVANGGTASGVRLLSPETVDRIFEVQSHDVDLVLGAPIKFGLGYGLASDLVPYVPQEGRIALWSGWGGSITLVDVERRMSFGFAMNKMAPGVVGGPSVERLIPALYALL